MPRPTEVESRRRTREFVRLVVAGKRWRLAARQAGVNPDRALDVLNDLAGCGVVTVDREQAA